MGGEPTRTASARAGQLRALNRLRAEALRASCHVALGRPPTVGSPPKTISASGSGRCRAAGRVAHRSSSVLSVAAVRIIVGFAPAGGTDIVARLVGQWLSERLGQQFVVENRPGAGTDIAAEAVVRAAPDGYTLLLAASPNAINASLYDKLSFNFIRDIAPVAAISREPNVVLVNPSVPTRTVPEFIAYTKANPGRVNMASAGNGTTSHLAGELFKMMTGVNMVHVPYRSTTQLTDLLAGQVQVSFPPMVVAIAQVKAGKLRALAVTTAIRSEAFTPHDGSLRAALSTGDDDGALPGSRCDTC